MAYRAHFVATGTLSRFATGTLPFAAEGKASAVIGRIEFPDRSRLSYWMQAEVRCNPQLPVFYAYNASGGGIFDPVYRCVVKGKLLTVDRRAAAPALDVAGAALPRAEVRPPSSACTI